MLKKIKMWFYKIDAQRKARKVIARLRVEERELAEKANPHCPKCYGRGHRGLILTTTSWKACICTTNTRWKRGRT